MIDEKTVKFGDVFRYDTKSGLPGHDHYMFIAWTEYEGKKTWAAWRLLEGAAGFQEFTEGFSGDYIVWEYVDA